MRSILLLCVFVFSCADTTPPTWPSRGALEFVEVGTHSARLRWPAASDDEGIGGYRIRKEGAFLTQLAPSVTEAEVDGLDEAATVRLSVEAVDFAGNPSEPLVVEVTTQDGTPPSWPAGATLTASPQNEGSTMLLEWTEAEDNRAVTGYVILREGEVLGEPGADTTSFRTEGSTEGLRVVAVDEAGNRSAPLSLRMAETADTIAATPAPGEDAQQAEETEPPTAVPAIRAPLTPALERALRSATQFRHDQLRVPVMGMFELPHSDEAASPR